MKEEANHDLTFHFNDGDELRVELIERIKAFLAQHPEIMEIHQGQSDIIPITVKFGVKVLFN